MKNTIINAIVQRSATSEPRVISSSCSTRAEFNGPTLCLKMQICTRGELSAKNNVLWSRILVTSVTPVHCHPHSRKRFQTSPRLYTWPFATAPTTTCNAYHPSNTLIILSRIRHPSIEAIADKAASALTRSKPFIANWRYVRT